MGNYQDTLREITSTSTSTRGNMTPNQNHPSESTWFLRQAKDSKLLIPEVIYLWEIFKKLGSTSDGYLSDEHVERIPDPLMKKILSVFKPSDDRLSFGIYLKAIAFYSSLNLDDKIKVSFRLINNGQPLDKSEIWEIVQLIYPHKTDDELKEITEMLFGELDKNKTGFITEEKFLAAQNEFLPEELKEICELTILPKDLQENLDNNLPEFYSCQDLCSLPDTGKLVPSDSLLKTIAKHIANNKDWKKVIGELGFRHEDIKNLEAKFNQNETPKLIFHLLLCWKECEGEDAHAEILEKALLDCSFVDVAILLAP